MTGYFSRVFPNPSPARTYRRADKPGTKPPVKAGDPEYEASQPITPDDRRQMLRTYFRTKGLSEAEIDAHVSKAKV